MASGPRPAAMSGYLVQVQVQVQVQVYLSHTGSLAPGSPTSLSGTPGGVERCREGKSTPWKKGWEVREG